jgi:hypothetical protein
MLAPGYVVSGLSHSLWTDAKCVCPEIDVWLIWPESKSVGPIAQLHQIYLSERKELLSRMHVGRLDRATGPAFKKGMKEAHFMLHRGSIDPILNNREQLIGAGNAAPGNSHICCTRKEVVR